jgi:DNA-binding XRE family transcriptional regulator
MDEIAEGNRAQHFAWTALKDGTARRLRETAGYSLVRASEVAGVNKNSIWLWEKGRATPSKVSATVYGCFLLNLARFFPQVVDHE